MLVLESALWLCFWGISAYRTAGPNWPNRSTGELKETMSGQAAVQTQTATKPNFTAIASGVLQRQCACGQHTSAGGECEDCKQKRAGTLQRAAINPTPVHKVPPIVHEMLRSPGQPLDAQTRAYMEPRFGRDFSNVRVHTDAEAAESARMVYANAYTVGRDMVFGANLYAPGTATGKRLLAHELTHVIQQGAAGLPDDLQLDASVNSSEQEAQQVASIVLSSTQRVPMSTYELGVLLQRQETSSTSSMVNPEVADLPAVRYVDNYSSVIYDLDYRHQDGNLSKWLKVNYADGTSIDVWIDDILEEGMDPRVALQMMANGHVGAGGRIFPERMNPRTTPRLYAAKQEAIRIMEEYNFQFILGTLPAVMFILTMGIGSVGGGGRPTRMTRTPVSRIPLREPEPPPPLEEPPVRPGPASGGRSTTPVPSTGTPGNRAASVRDAEARAAQRAPTAALTAAQQTMRDTLIREHPGLNPNVAADAVRGAERVMGPGGRGADVVLITGGRREVSVHSGAFTSQSIGAHLLDEAAQAGTSEIYLQINTGARAGFLRMLPGLRSGYAELRGIFVKIFGPDGQVWWNGIFRGLE